MSSWPRPSTRVAKPRGRRAVTPCRSHVDRVCRPANCAQAQKKPGSSERETICGLGNRKDAMFHEMLCQEGVAVYEDTIAQIGNWKQHGLQVAVISSSRNCTEVLQTAGVLGLFDIKVDGNDLERLQLQKKPAPDGFLRTAEALDVAPERAIVVEDAIVGVQVGEHAVDPDPTGRPLHAGLRQMRGQKVFEL